MGGSRGELLWTAASSCATRRSASRQQPPHAQPKPGFFAPRPTNISGDAGTLRPRGERRRDRSKKKIWQTGGVDVSGVWGPGRSRRVPSLLAACPVLTALLQTTSGVRTCRALAWEGRRSQPKAADACPRAQPRLRSTSVSFTILLVFRFRHLPLHPSIYRNTPTYLTNPVPLATRPARSSALSEFFFPDAPRATGLHPAPPHFHSPWTPAGLLVLRPQPSPLLPPLLNSATYSTPSTAASAPSRLTRAVYNAGTSPFLRHAHRLLT